MCKFVDKTENGLLSHYNTINEDLCQLGMKLIKSKETRRMEKE